MSDRSLQRRINIKFCVKIGNRASETLSPLTLGYGECDMKKLSVFEWHRRFKEGREDAPDDRRSEEPSTQGADANVDRVRTLVRSDRRLGAKLTAEELNVLFSIMTMPLCMMR
jgi:hypothetical protein